MCWRAGPCKVVFWWWKTGTVLIAAINWFRCEDEWTDRYEWQTVQFFVSTNSHWTWFDFGFLKCVYKCYGSFKMFRRSMDNIASRIKLLTLLVIHFKILVISHVIFVECADFEFEKKPHVSGKAHEISTFVQNQQRKKTNAT